MLVKNWMSKPAITIEADALMLDAIKLLQKHEIHMLPVMENDQLVGVVKDRDLKRTPISDATSEDLHEFVDFISRTKIKTVMASDPITVPYDYTLEETAELLLVNNISGLPVVNQAGKVIGIITKTDIFRLILILSGAGKKGIQFALEVKDRPGSLKEITDTMRDYGGRVSSIISTHERAGKGNYRSYIRIYNIDRPSLQRLKEVIKERATLLYMVDHHENNREIY